MQIYNQYVIDPEPFRNPHYNISPFSTNWISVNNKTLRSANGPDEVSLRNLFGNHLFLDSGRKALFVALSYYGLKKEDEVWIVTPSGNRYVSGCVTGEIEKICSWSREYTDRTRVILVVHEFGIIYPAMEELLRYNLPIIEDMAMSLLSTDSSGRAGAYGDFTLYSLSKFFPLQFGGVLRMNNPLTEEEIRTAYPEENAPYLKKLLSQHIDDLDCIRRKRWENYRLYENCLAPIGLEGRFKYTERETPSVYMFKTSDRIDLPGLKEFMQRNGIESSVFYGENSFFVPVHQNLNQEDIRFISSLIQYYHENCS